MDLLKTFKAQYIQAAGRTFSEKNVKRLKAAFVEIATLLIDAGLLDLTTLEGLETKVNKQVPAAEPPIDETATEVLAGTMDEFAPVQNESFSTVVARAAWLASLEQCIHIFLDRFTCLHVDTAPQIKASYGENVDRKGEIEKLINDLAQFLVGLHHIYPPTPEDPVVNPGTTTPAVTPETATTPDTMVMAAAPPAPEVAAEGETERSPQQVEQPVQLSAINGIDLTFQCPAVPIQAAAHNLELNNKYPIKGVLFRVGEPSEAIPAVGPGLPIYISEDVASTIIADIAGLPLDCHDSLDQHSIREGFGVIMAGAVKDKDFIIEGYLHDWSQPEKVELIRNQHGRLGMSMDATAIGYKANVDDREVFYVTQLKLRGATILFNDKATYRQTRLLPTSENTKTEVAKQVAIAAAGELPPIEPELGTPDVLDAIAEPDTTTPVTPQQEPAQVDEQLAAKIASIAQTLEIIHQSLTSQVQKVDAHTQVLENVVAKVQMMEEEREQAALAVQAAAEQEKKKKEEDEMLLRLQSLVEQSIKTAVNPNALNGRRLTTPLAAAAVGVGNGKPGAISAEELEVSMQLSRLEGEISASQHDLPKVLRLTEEKRNLEGKRNQIRMHS